MATLRYTLTTDAWTNLGAAPVFIQLLGQHPIRFVIESSQPTTLRKDTHYLSKDLGLTADVGLTGNVYAYSEAAPGQSSVIAVSR